MRAADAPPRILRLNPNTTAFVTETVAAALRATLGPRAQVIPATAGFGAAIIKSRLDDAVAQHAAVTLPARVAAIEAESADRTGDRAAPGSQLLGAAAGLADAGADVVALLGAVLAGAADRLPARASAQIGVPLVDGGRAGALMIEAMIRLGAPAPRRDSDSRRIGLWPRRAPRSRSPARRQTERRAHARADHQDRRPPRRPLARRSRRRARRPLRRRGP